MLAERLGVTIGDFNSLLILTYNSFWLNNSLAAQEKTISTFLPLRAEVSKHLCILCFFAYSIAYSFDTARYFSSSSDLFPMRYIFTSGGALC